MHFLNVNFEMRYARRDEGCSFSFVDVTGFFTARIRCKFITVDILHMVSQFINRAQRFHSFLIGFGHVINAEKALGPLTFFRNYLYF
jgi:hypothetical protein